MSADGGAAEAAGLVRDGTIAALATSDSGGPMVCAVFYVVDSSGQLGFKSRRSAQHIAAVQEDPRAAIAVYDYRSNYSEKWGVQLRGMVREIVATATMSEIVDLYGKRFAGSAGKLPSIQELVLPETASTFFLFEAESFRLIAEDRESVRTMGPYEPYEGVRAVLKS